MNPRRSRRQLGYDLLLLLALAGCADGGARPRPDVERLGDAGPRRDAGRDTGAAFTRCDPDAIGRLCRDATQCGRGGFCLELDDKTGVCSCPCRPDNPMTLAIEDDCPAPQRHVCASIEVAGQAGAAEVLDLCMRQCDPRLGANDCVAPLSCQPASMQQNPRNLAICLSLGCTTDRDCLVSTAETCQVATPACTAGGECLPERFGSATGLCVRSGRCDLASGLCAPRQAAGSFSGTARVGDPCRSDIECGASMFCALEIDLSTQLKAAGASCQRPSECCSGQCLATGRCGPGSCGVLGRNGYCTIEGCSFPSLSAYACPAGSTCNGLYPAGWCQRSCDPREAADCRGVPADRYGDYECRAWNRVELISGRPLTDGPVCDFGLRSSCATIAELGLDCAQLGLPGNPTAMVCRALDGKVTTDPAAATGYCFDATASGPPP